MNISMSSQVLEDLKKELSISGKSVVRFVVSSIGCQGPLFDIQFSDLKDGDATADVNGIQFVVARKLEATLKSPKIVRQGNRFIVKRSACGCKQCK